MKSATGSGGALENGSVQERAISSDWQLEYTTLGQLQPMCYRTRRGGGGRRGARKYVGRNICVEKNSHVTSSMKTVRLTFVASKSELIRAIRYGADTQLYQHLDRGLKRVHYMNIPQSAQHSRVWHGQAAMALATDSPAGQIHAKLSRHWVQQTD